MTVIVNPGTITFNTSNQGRVSMSWTAQIAPEELLARITDLTLTIDPERQLLSLAEAWDAANATVVHDATVTSVRKNPYRAQVKHDGRL